MPKISEFFGISIYLYYRDHSPPHFHAFYSGSQVQIAISTLEVLKGHLPPRAMGMVMEWAELRREDLLKVWKQATEGQPLNRVSPLG